MALLKVTSPHAHGPASTRWVMAQVIFATTPGVLALTYFFGFGSLVNILWACLVALGAEALFLKLRGRENILFYLKDNSALVTAVLLGIALPPYAPWWIVLLGTTLAIMLAKQLYGGMGYNPFNPAMAAYVILLISFPVQMTQWSAPMPLVDGYIGPLAAFLNNFGFSHATDGFTGATPLDIMKQNSTLLIEQLWQQNPAFGLVGGIGWEWVNAGFLLGGLYLLARRIFTWHTPVALLGAMGIMALVGYDGGSSASGGSPLFHWFSGATMLGAFFIATDPVTSAVSTRGRLAYGACIGVLVYVIRVWGNYPDAMAFSVLLMNFAAPFIDHYTQPRTYGYSKGGKK